MIKFSHTIFAMPFALFGYFIGLSSIAFQFELRIILLIILCMVLARNAAMAFNRYIDKGFDKSNPRTATREIPSGVISPGAALIFIIINAILFIVASGFINPLTLILSPVALIVILGYSLTKRFTSYSHIFLGLALGLAPIGAYISVTGSFNIIPILTGLQVLAWVGGFDIIYSLQDEDFDRDNNLHSIPSRFGGSGAIIISRTLHILSICFALVAGLLADFGIIYFIGCVIFGVLLVWEHIVARQGDKNSINMAFATVNSYAGVAFVACAIADILI